MTPLPATIANLHQELFRQDISSPLFPVILGMPWLQAHNPCINLSTREVTFSSPYWQQHCLQRVAGNPSSLMWQDTEARQSVPVVYHDFLDFFSKKDAETLPPHRVYDSPIELLPGAEVPFGRIFPLTELELGALKYIDENLEKGVYPPVHISCRSWHLLRRKEGPHSTTLY